MEKHFKIEPHWSRSKEEIWKEHFEEMVLQKEPKSAKTGISVRRTFYYTAIAAMVIILLIPFVYIRTIETNRGEHRLLLLPDGSSATLNAESKISYRPLYWNISRKVKMEGEVYFEVEKGGKFEVKSKNGTVKVLGTKFNVLSRGDSYFVSCITGKVEVISGERVVLEKDCRVTKGKDGTLFLEKRDDVGKIISWRDNMFYFSSAPLSDVLEEISRQYNVKIEYSNFSDYLYSGNFSKESDVSVVLQIVALPFGIKLERSQDGYIMSKP